MAGERDLRRLLTEMRPELSADEFVYVQESNNTAGAALHPIVIVEEPEGRAWIVTKVQAEAAGLPYTYPCRRITLKVHSSLDAIGLLAEVTRVLAVARISANCVSGYFHDHLFVASEQAVEALGLLLRLSRDHAREVQ